jgi:hypothetical protein
MEADKRRDEIERRKARLQEDLRRVRLSERRLLNPAWPDWRRARAALDRIPERLLDEGREAESAKILSMIDELESAVDDLQPEKEAKEGS